MDAVIVPDVRTLAAEQSQPPIYDRPIGVTLLHRDERTGAEHYLIRYPPGLRAQRHTHTAAHTVVVLDGRLRANGVLVGPGGYVHFAAGAPMHHEPDAGTGCTFVTIFDGPFDVAPAP